MNNRVNPQWCLQGPMIGSAHSLEQRVLLMVLKHLAYSVFELHLPYSLHGLVSRELVTNFFPL